MNFTSIKYILGIYFITSPFLFKLIIKRLPRDIYTINNLIIIFLCMLFLLLSLKCLHNTFFLKKEKEAVLWLKLNLLKPLTDFYWGNILLIDNYIKNYIMGPKYLGETLVKVSKYINNYLTDKNSTKYVLIYFFMDVLPKITFVILFIYDVFFIEKFLYIYLFGWICLIPLIWRYIIFTFKEFSEYNITCMHEELLYFFTLKDEELSTSSLIDNCKNIYHIDTIDSSGIPQRRVALRQEVSTQEENDIILDDYITQFDSFMQIRMSVHVFETFRSSFWNVMFTFNYFFLQFYIWCYLFLINYHTFNLISLLIRFINTLQILEDPFSGILLITF